MIVRDAQRGPTGSTPLPSSDGPHCDATGITPVTTISRMIGISNGCARSWTRCNGRRSPELRHSSVTCRGALAAGLSDRANPDLIRRANQGHGNIIARSGRARDGTSADADERIPRVRLTRRANHGHLEYRRTNRKARAARWRAFLMALQQGSFSKPFVAFLRLVRCPEKYLTRRANQAHSRIIAKLLKPARRNPRRAFSLEFSESDGGRTSRRHISHARRLSVVSAPPSEPFRSKLISRCARTCRHAAWPEPRPHAAPAAKG